MYKRGLHWDIGVFLVRITEHIEGKRKKDHSLRV